MTKPRTFDGRKILLTVHQFFPEHGSGTEVLTLSVARELMARGYEVNVFTGHPSVPEIMEEERFDEYECEGIHVYRFHHAYTPMYGQTSKVELSYNNNLAANYFEQILERFRPDLVHFFHLDRLGTGLINLTVSAGIPAYMTPTDFWLICPTAQMVLCNGSMCQGPSPYGGNCIKHLAEIGQKGLAGRLVKWLPTSMSSLLARLTQANVMPPYPHHGEIRAISSRLKINMERLNQLNGIVTPNRFMSEKLVEHGLSPHLVIQSTFGIDVDRNIVNAIRRSSRQPFRVGYIGTLATHKGCHILIEAFKALPAGQAILKIYGRMEDFPEYSSDLKRLAENNETIEFCGTFHNSKIGEVLAGLDVLVVPSLWYENTPLVVYSAQAACCPVVASDFPGLSAVIQDQLNGLLFEAGNSAALTKQLSRLINEPDLVERLSANSQQPKSTSSYVDELLNIWKGHK
jgi:glycosyltransferase involved in cell wall biosynthesis